MWKIKESHFPQRLLALPHNSHSPARRYPHEALPSCKQGSWLWGSKWTSWQRCWGLMVWECIEGFVCVEVCTSQGVVMKKGRSNQYVRSCGPGLFHGNKIIMQRLMTSIHQIRVHVWALRHRRSVSNITGCNYSLTLVYAKYDHVQL